MHRPLPLIAKISHSHLTDCLSEPPCHAMDTARKSAQQLREQIAQAEEELRGLREQLAQAEANEQDQEAQTTAASANGSAWKWPLKAEEYDRYGRQLILPKIGIQGQITLPSHCKAVPDILLQASRGSKPPRSSSLELVASGAQQQHISPVLESAPWASSTATSWSRPTCTVRSPTGHQGWACSRWTA